MKDLKSLAGISEANQKCILDARRKASLAETAFTRAMDTFYWSGKEDMAAIKPYFEALEAADAELNSLRAEFNV